MMSFKNQILFWLSAFFALVIFLFIFRGILLPFVAGMALAYCLDPVADRFERLGLGRMLATLIILLISLIIFGLALIIITPLLGTQIANLIENLPGIITQLQNFISRQAWLETFLGESQSEMQQSLSSLLRQSSVWLAALMQSLWSGGQTILNITSLFVITPVVAFYLLYDWDRMTAKIDSWLPKDHASVIRDLLRQIDEALAGFIRGQGLVSLILGAFYAISLSLVGLSFGLLIGFTAGIISFIPYVGSIVGFIIAISVALVQFWPDYIQIGLVAFIFVFGQFMEGNILQPRLVGQSVGLHPVWLIFALFAFGSLFGFVGLLMAIPMAASLGVLVRFGLQRYLQSPYYIGQGSHSKSEDDIE